MSSCLDEYPWLASKECRGEPRLTLYIISRLSSLHNYSAHDILNGIASFGRDVVPKLYYVSLDF